MFDYTSFPRAGFMRRLGSYIYDLLLAAAVYMLAGFCSFLILFLLHYFGVYGNQGHEHFIDTVTNTWWLKWPNEIWKIYWVAYFFVYFWNRNGQTLGMRAWRLRVQNLDGSLISKPVGWKRLATGILGMGNLWVIVNYKGKQSLQDIATNTEVVTLSLEANKGRGWVN